MSLTQRRWRYLKHNLDTGTQPGLKLGILLDLLVTVKSLPAVLETQVWSLGQEDPMEKETATHSGTLAWKNPMDGRAWQDTVHGVAKSQTRLSSFTFTLHFHALEKEMATHSSILAWRIPGTGAWWAAVYGVAQSRTRLKWLSSSSSSKPKSSPKTVWESVPCN